MLPKGYEGYSKDESQEIETILLDSLDGFGFEALCQRIFEKSGWGQVERIGMTGDAGRDLIIHSSNKEKIIVECKHQPKTSIGRPVVQKLHSAIISSHTNQGIIITTGKFSKQAIEYAKDLSDGTSIQLFDMYKLTELAQKGGIEITNTGEDLRLFTFPLSDEKKLKESILSKLLKVQCHPAKISESLELISESTSLLATYEAIIDLNQDFITSAGLIHEIRINSKNYHFDGTEGYPLNTYVYEFLPTYNSTILFNESKIDESIKISKFSLDRTTLVDKIHDSVIHDQTTTVSYRGKNNVTYNKTCKPTKKNIRINDINQILVPEYKFQLKVFGKSYSCTIMETKNRFNFKSIDLFTCKICHQQIFQDNFLLCNSCGNMCHSTKIKPSHSYLCEICNKTLCQDCTYYIRKYLVMKKKVCHECAKENSKNPKKLIKHN
jgi:restriction system protein